MTAFLFSGPTRDWRGGFRTLWIVAAFVCWASAWATWFGGWEVWAR